MPYIPHHEVRGEGVLREVCSLPDRVGHSEMPYIPHHEVRGEGVLREVCSLPDRVGHSEMPYIPHHEVRGEGVLGDEQNRSGDVDIKRHPSLSLWSMVHLGRGEVEEVFLQ
jgi:hypothetical protein